jgi:hypothetical protein
MEITYDPTPADQPEFTAEELDSLQVGENLQAAEERMLAGKYENAEQLEKAYLELQSKFGSNAGDRDEQGPVSEEESYSEEEESETYEEEDVELTEVDKAILDASDEWYDSGQLSEETFQALSQMDSEELLDSYMRLQEAMPEEQAADLSDREVDAIYNFAGGAEQFNAITQWAGENMSEEYIAAYDNIVDQGDAATIQLAVAGLMAAYYENNGYEGRMYSGQEAYDQNLPYFRSQAEVVEAMSDPRYDTDPAYRQDVYEALERSNIQY